VHVDRVLYIALRHTAGAFGFGPLLTTRTTCGSYSTVYFMPKASQPLAIHVVKLILLTTNYGAALEWVPNVPASLRAAYDCILTSHKLLCRSTVRLLVQ
jgi:hypothetical protein